MKGLADLEVAGRTVLVRCDLNVPLVKGANPPVISDDGRIVASLPTIRALSDAGARVVILSHLGRPKGVRDAALSLAPAAKRMGELLGRPVTMVDAVAEPTVASAVSAMSDGDIAVLENVRFDPRETSKDATERGDLASEWAALGDLFVSDGFGVVHREQASVTDLARLLPNAAGLLVEKEVQAFQRVLVEPARPYTVVMGGSKVSDKLAVIENLVPLVDRLLIGGGMAFTFLKAQGFEVGDSLLESDMVPTVQKVMREAQQRGVEIVLPSDVVVATDISADAQTKVVAASAIPEGWKGLDIGPRTAETFASAIADSGTVVWNGPMGVFEFAPFASGTRAVAQALADTPAFSVIGGGDSAAAIRLLGLDESRFDHVSTGGGASLELLEGRTLPGLAVLEESA